MQLAMHVSLVAAVAGILFLGRALMTTPEAAPLPAPTPTPPAPRSTPAFATVAKPFGASVRVAPSWESAGLYNLGCGMTVPVESIAVGWVKIRTEGGSGWIAASRVTVGDDSTAADCAGMRFLFPGTEAGTFVPNGCLMLRSRPSRDAAELACVGNGHPYAVVDGPFDPGAGGDWFRVSSQTTGTGWVQAEHLYPL